MLRTTTGDLLGSDAQMLVNPVNCVGVMGAGLALAFKTRWPEMFDNYHDMCTRGMIRPGCVHVWDSREPLPGEPTRTRLVACVPTKRHWREPSRLADVEAGLVALRHVLMAKRVTSVALPPLGCGLGGLDWQSQVAPLVTKHLGGYARRHGVDVEVYAPLP